MDRWSTRTLLAVALAVAASACTRTEGVAGPDDARLDTRVVEPATPDTTVLPPPEDAAAADSSGGRWGGYIGGGN